MHLEEAAETLAFTSRRTDSKGPPADFSARWSRGKALTAPSPDSLDFFLVERYCLYAAREEKLYRARIHHQPWSLRAATVETLASTMGESHGIKLSDKPALVHAQGEPLAVEVWPLKEVAARER